MKKGFKSKSYYEVQPISLTSDLLDIADMLQDLKQPRLSQLSDDDFNELIYKGKLPFLNNSFNLTSIPFIPYDLLQKLEIISKYKEMDFNSFIDLINNYLTTLDPFNIPILSDDTLGFEGGYCNPMFLGVNREIEKLIFAEFVITNKLSILTLGIYAHEVVHSQLEFNNGLNNYIHSEVLPIFFDKLTALYVDNNYETLKINEKLRFIKLFKAIDGLKSNNLSLYQETKLSMGIISILEAEKLFDKYLYGTNNDKDNIVLKINDVLLGNIKLEDLLKDTEISVDSCQDKKLIKRKVNGLL